jgi:hypothetical protein
MISIMPIDSVGWTLAFAIYWPMILFHGIRRVTGRWPPILLSKFQLLLIFFLSSRSLSEYLFVQFPSTMHFY